MKMSGPVMMWEKSLTGTSGGIQERAASCVLPVAEWSVIIPDEVHIDSPKVIIADIEGGSLTIKVVGRQHFSPVLSALRAEGFSVFGDDEVQCYVQASPRQKKKAGRKPSPGQ